MDGSMRSLPRFHAARCRRRPRRVPRRGRRFGDPRPGGGPHHRPDLPWVSRCVTREDRAPSDDGPADPARRRFLVGVGVGGFALALAGAADRLARPKARPGPTPHRSRRRWPRASGAEYMELVRARLPARALGRPPAAAGARTTARTTPTNRSRWCRRTRAPATRAVWMYLERVPLVVYGPGIVATERQHRARLARRPRPDHRAR